VVSFSYLDSPVEGIKAPAFASTEIQSNLPIWICFRVLI
jgi:hypothetical protein